MNRYIARKKSHRREKQFIGIYVANYLREHAPNLPIAVDGGSTNFYVLQGIYQDINYKEPTVSSVLTNNIEGLMFSCAISEDEEQTTVWRSTGGIVRPSRQVLTGIEATSSIKEYSMWMCVIGANGFEIGANASKPLTMQTTTDREHVIKKEMINQARETVIFPIDSSKWGMPTGSTFFSLDEIARMGKRAVLITCCPMPDGNETHPEFDQRTERFLNTFEDLVNQVDKLGTQNYELKVSVTPIIETGRLTLDSECPLPLDIPEVRFEPSMKFTNDEIVKKLEELQYQKKQEALVVETELSVINPELIEKSSRNIEGKLEKNQPEYVNELNSEYDKLSLENKINWIIDKNNHEKFYTLLENQEEKTLRILYKKTRKNEIILTSKGKRIWETIFKFYKNKNQEEKANSICYDLAKNSGSKFQMMINDFVYDIVSSFWWAITFDPEVGKESANNLINYLVKKPADEIKKVLMS